MHFLKRTDENQKAIVRALKAMGASVLDLSRVGQGCPDILVGKGKKMALVEIKSSSKATYTKPQLLFMEAWRGSKPIRVESIDDAINLIKTLDT
jgi:hypothetical protein